jgi:hypothetical protein
MATKVIVRKLNRLAEVQPTTFKSEADREMEEVMVVPTGLRKKINLTLAPDSITRARTIGNGNVSRGIDIAVDHFKSCVKRNNERPHRRANNMRVK